MVFFKESSGGSPAVKIIESKEQYGPQGIEKRDTIDAQSVFESTNVVANMSKLYWYLTILAIIIMIIVLVVIFSKTESKKIESNQNE